MEAPQQDLDARVRRLLADGDVAAASEFAVRELGPGVLRFVRVRNDAWQRRRTPLSRGRASELAEQVRTRTPLVRERQARALEALRSKLTVEEQSLLALRVDQELPWAGVAEVIVADGKPVQLDALMKRFQRLKERIALLAREDGLVE